MELMPMRTADRSLMTPLAFVGMAVVVVCLILTTYWVYERRLSQIDRSIEMLKDSAPP